MSLLRVGILSATEVFGDFMLKRYSTFGTFSSLGLGLLGYVGVVVSLIWSFKTGNVLMINGLWDGVSTLVESLAAYIILGDRLDSVYQYAGLLFILVGVFMVKWKSA